MIALSRYFSIILTSRVDVRRVLDLSCSLDNCAISKTLNWYLLLPCQARGINGNNRGNALARKQALLIAILSRAIQGLVVFILIIVYCRFLKIPGKPA